MHTNKSFAFLGYKSVEKETDWLFIKLLRKIKFRVQMQIIFNGKCWYIMILLKLSSIYRSSEFLQQT